MIAFSVHYDTEIDGDWHPVFRVDASPFEKPHLHTFYPDGSHRKEFLADDGKSLAAVFHEWNSHVIERYETYKERYLQHYEHRRNRS